MQRTRQTDPDLTPICDASEALLAAEALAAARSTDFSDFSEDAEPTRAMMRDDIPNEPMLLERRAKGRDSEDPVYPEAAVPEIVDFAERMSSEPPAQIVPAPRVSKFVAQPAPEALLPAAARPIQPPPPAKPAPLAKPAAPAPPPPPPKATRSEPMFPSSEPARHEDGSLASATVEAPTPPAPRAEIVSLPAAVPARPSRAERARTERGQQGALVFLGLCALAATGLIGVSVGRSSVPPAATQAPAAAPQVAAPQNVGQPAAAAVVAPAATVAAGAAQDTSRNTATKTAGTPVRVAEKADKADKPAAEATPAPVVAPPADGPVAPAFDAASATAALSGLTGSVQSCGDGAGGTARVAVTFAPSGRVTQAIVEGAPYAGTPAGGCIAAKARSASIPAFTGAPVTVRKSYTMN